MQVWRTHIDVQGHHPLACHYSACRIPRQSELNDIIKRALSTDGVRSILGQDGLDRGGGKRPDGLILNIDIHRGQCILWNVAAIDTFCDLYSSFVTRMLKPRWRRQKKQNIPLDIGLFDPVSWFLKPLASLGTNAKDFINEVGHHMTLQATERSESMFPRQGICFAILHSMPFALHVFHDGM